MAFPSRTLHPLPFEHLEPHRFEDLVRQLVYDFRPWRALEATGRAGNDDGFDARGWEVVMRTGSSRPEEAVEEDEEPDDGGADRLWLIQCKRERSIGPTKIANYLDAILPEASGSIYGIIFAAACDFSKKSRDAFREKCIALGLNEFHIWGKAELEDRLFRPDNDHLLFA